MSKAVAERETVVSADAHMSKLGKDYSSDGDADPETGDVEPLPTQMGMEISFKVGNPSAPRPKMRVELQRQTVCMRRGRRSVQAELRG